MYPAARIGDPITHDMIAPSGVIGPPLSGPPLEVVMIEGLPSGFVGCTCPCSGATSAGPVHPPPAGALATVTTGSTSVSINYMPAARWSPAPDVGTCGVFLGDPKLAATRTVFIGG